MGGYGFTEEEAKTLDVNIYSQWDYKLLMVTDTLIHSTSCLCHTGQEDRGLQAETEVKYVFVKLYWYSS